MGDVCPTCKRPVKPEHEGPAGPPRKRFSVSVPPGEDGVLDDLMIQFVERFQPAWAAGVEMPPIGARHWKYIALHHLLYSVVTASPEVAAGLLPAEVGA